jgi:hypothetical protein
MRISSGTYGGEVKLENGQISMNADMVHSSGREWSFTMTFINPGWVG